LSEIDIFKGLKPEIAFASTIKSPLDKGFFTFYIIFASLNN